MTLTLSEITQGGKVFSDPVLQTGNYTASSWDIVLADTASIGAFTVTLPAAPLDGDTIRVADYSTNFSSANLTISPNGLKIRGAVQNITCDVDDVVITLTYSGSAKGWIFSYPPGGSPAATTTNKGVIEVATGAETITGTDAERAVTPAGLQSNIASNAEVLTGTSTSKLVAPASVGNQMFRKNLIINGDMKVAQRGTIATGLTSGGYYTVDRFALNRGHATWTLAQSTPGPDGFGSSFQATCTTADASPSAAVNTFLYTLLEGQDLQHLLKGTASAKNMMLSFKARSNQANDFVIEVKDYDNNRHICKLFTLTGSGTWDSFEMAIPGDTTGSFGDDNNVSLGIFWRIGAGSNFNSGTLQTSWTGVVDANTAAGGDNFAANINDYFDLTAVQLEVGSEATPFEHRTFSEELALCQRYAYYIWGNNSTVTATCMVMVNSANTSIGVVHFPVTMRAAPTLVSSASTSFQVGYGNNALNTCDTTDPISTVAINENSSTVQFTNTAHGYTSGLGGYAVIGTNSAAYLGFHTEL